MESELLKVGVRFRSPLRVPPNSQNGQVERTTRERASPADCFVPPFAYWAPNGQPFGDEGQFRTAKGTGTVTFGPHLGADCITLAGTEVSAVASGKCVRVECQLGRPGKRFRWGHVVTIRHNVVLRGYDHPTLRCYSIYGHMGEVRIQTNQRVTCGDVIGTVGEANTAENGMWPDALLHLGILVDPRYEHTPELWPPGFAQPDKIGVMWKLEHYANPEWLFNNMTAELYRVDKKIHRFYNNEGRHENIYYH